MQVSKIPSQTSFNGFFNSKALLKTAEFAADNGALFAAGTSLVLSTFVRPLMILATPKASKENKEYACSKSIASSLVGFGVMALISNPIIKAVNNIENEPQKYLKEKTIEAFKWGQDTLNTSKKFRFSAQMFKLGSAFVALLPKALLTCALIPPVMSLFFSKKNEENIAFQKKNNTNNNISFSGNISQGISNKLSGLFAKVLDKKGVQEFSEKYYNTNFPQHMFNLNDIMATALFAKFTMDSKDIKQKNKKSLIWNASLMTAFTVAGGYLANSLLKKPTELFIEKFKKANLNEPKLDKYIEGIKIAKPALILGGMYYILAPMAATILAEQITDKGRVK